MKSAVKPTLILAAVAFFSSITLALLNNATSEKIKELDAQKQKRALSQVLPNYTISGTAELNYNSNKITYWKAKDSSGSEGYAYIVSEPGYSGDLKTMVGVNSEFIIQGIYILDQTETPGLGARCGEIKSELTFFDFISGKRETSEKKPWFQEQFISLNISKPIAIVKKGDWTPSMKDSLIKDNSVTAITGATITTSAVKRSLEKSAELFKKILEENSDKNESGDNNETI